jgi:Tol biopolymer transport system component
MRLHHSRVCGSTLVALTAALACAAPAHATFPGHDGRLLFSVITDDGVQIKTVRPDGRDVRQVTYVAGDAVHPDWSPDGRSIVFALETEETANIAFVGANGGPVRVLPAPPGTFESQPSFSPGGHRIVFSQFDGTREAAWSMHLDGTDRRLITAGPGDATDPNASPDGRSISFVGVPNGQWEVEQALFTSRLDGRHVRQLTPFSSEVAIKQDWAPDGRRLVFTTNADFVVPGGSANLATIRPDGSGMRSLTHFSGGEVNAFAGSYSPSGKRIAFRYEDHGRYGLYTVRTDGSHPRPVLPLSVDRPRYIDWGSR